MREEVGRWGGGRGMEARRRGRDTNVQTYWLMCKSHDTLFLLLSLFPPHKL